MEQQNINKEINKLKTWRAGSRVSLEAVNQFGIEKCFLYEDISDSVFQRINGISYKPNKHISITDLRYVKALHYDIDGYIYIGEIVCNKSIAEDLVDIFHELYNHRSPIHRMVLIDEYGADDDKSMRDNNTSCFCYRTIAGTERLSNHAYGKAIDINPLYNPCVELKEDGSLLVSPETGQMYRDRHNKTLYRINKTSLYYKLFIKHGFEWGGDWKSLKDYQHFEKKEPVIKVRNKINLDHRKRYLRLIALFFAIIAMLTPLLFTLPNIGVDWGFPHQIGDTFAITIPFLTLISIWLTFEAFWVQVEANENQAKISEEQLELTKTQADISRKQQEEIQLERFTNTYMSFVQLLNNQENEIYIKNVGYSKQAFHYMLYEYKAMALLTYNHLNKNKDKRAENRHYILMQAYNVFINGVSKTINTKIKGNAPYGEILSNYFIQLRDKLKEHHRDIPYLTDYNTKRIFLFDGHRLRIIPFFNATCKLIEFVYRSPSIRDDEKELYLDMMFSHFSEHELALLKLVHKFEFIKRGNKKEIEFLDPLYARHVHEFFEKGINKYISDKMNCDNEDHFIDVTIGCEGF